MTVCDLFILCHHHFLFHLAFVEVKLVSGSDASEMQSLINNAQAADAENQELESMLHTHVHVKV